MRVGAKITGEEAKKDVEGGVATALPSEERIASKVSKHRVRLVVCRVKLRLLGVATSARQDDDAGNSWVYRCE